MSRQIPLTPEQLKNFVAKNKKKKEETKKKNIPFKRSIKKIGRNELCPCGSGKKYKRCCGKRITKRL